MTAELPPLPWWVRLSLFVAYYHRASAGFPRMPNTVPADVKCMVWTCNEWCVVRSWRKPIRRIARPGCIHRGQ